MFTLAVFGNKSSSSIAGFWLWEVIALLHQYLINRHESFNNSRMQHYIHIGLSTRIWERKILYHKKEASLLVIKAIGVGTTSLCSWVNFFHFQMAGYILTNQGPTSVRRQDLQEELLVGSCLTDVAVVLLYSSALQPLGRLLYLNSFHGEKRWEFKTVGASLSNKHCKVVQSMLNIGMGMDPGVKTRTNSKR